MNPDGVAIDRSASTGVDLDASGRTADERMKTANRKRPPER